MSHLLLPVITQEHISEYFHSILYFQIYLSLPLSAFFPTNTCEQGFSVEKSNGKKKKIATITMEREGPLILN